MADTRNDTELVAAFKDGDLTAFVALTERYTDKVHNLAMRITRNPEDTEEILQDVFLTVYRKIDHFEGKSAFSSWLYRITANTSFMKLRKRKQHTAVSLNELGDLKESNFGAGRSDTTDVNFISSRHQLRSLLEESIQTLPHEYRAIFVMRDIDGFSNHDVGRILSISVPAVKSRLHRSRLMLRRKLQRFYDDYRSKDEIFFASAQAA